MISPGRANRRDLLDGLGEGRDGDLRDWVGGGKERGYWKDNWKWRCFLGSGRTQMQWKLP